jgi:hypothetical protein
MPRSVWNSLLFSAAAALCADARATTTVNPTGGTSRSPSLNSCSGNQAAPVTADLGAGARGHSGAGISHQ